MFVDHLTAVQVAALFPRNAHHNVAHNWPLLRNALKQWGLGDNELVVLYVLATISVETNPVFSPAAERPSKYSKSIDRAGYSGIQDAGTLRPFGQYDSSISFKHGNPVINKSLGNHLYHGKDENLMRARHGDPLPHDENDGEHYRGRGFVQLTGRYNYEVMQKQVGKHLGIDLVNNPDAASDPATAARIIASFVNIHKGAIGQAMKLGHYHQARKIVNKQGLHTREFEAFIRAYLAKKEQASHKTPHAHPAAHHTSHHTPAHPSVPSTPIKVP